MSKIKLLIVDDHSFFRQGIQLYLEGVEEIELVGEAGNGKEALAILNDGLKIDIVLMDLKMPEMDGIETTCKLKDKWPQIKVLVLTSFGSWDKVYEALQAGANGYVMKDAKPEELIAAIKAVTTGGSYFGAEVAQELVERVSGIPVRETELVEPLTDREMEVLSLLCQGMGNKEIAEELVVSVKTIKTHVSNILSKLNVNSRTQAAVYAMRHGLI